MLDTKKLLGGLLQSGLGQGSPLGGLLNQGLGTKASVGMGVLGLAMAAFEHFSNKQPGQARSQSQGIMGDLTAPGAMSPPPPPSSAQAAPPPPPGGGKGTAGGKGTSGGKQGAAAPTGDDATLLLQAMIASANADGEIDQGERQAIIDRIGRDGLDQEEVRFLEQELAAPKDLMEIVGQVSNPDMGRQVYAVSVLAAGKENTSEKAYLRMLASGLGLDDNEAADIRSQIRNL